MGRPWQWLKRITYGWLWVDLERERIRRQVLIDYSHPVAVAERAAQAALDEKIKECLANRPLPKRYQLSDHEFDPRTGVCRRCKKTWLDFYHVAGGKGVPCDSP